MHEESVLLWEIGTASRQLTLSTMLTRLAKIALIACIAFLMTLVVLNNVTDYDSNFQFVRHVMSMDTTFPENRLMWRAIISPVWQHIF